MATTHLAEHWADIKTIDNDDDSQQWVATLKDGTVVSGPDEKSMRDSLRLLLIERTSKATGTPVDALQARLKRTWRIRIHQPTGGDAEADEEDEAPLFDLFA